jgi:hypothetical protein
MRSAARLLIAAGVALALADASVVTLALPALLTDLGTTVEGVAAVIGVYTAVLAVTLPLAAWARRHVNDSVLAGAGFGVFALACALCATADTLGQMLVFRGVQAGGAAFALVAAFSALGGGRLWVAAAVFGTAAGPALGGALTQAFDWPAIFAFQAPVAFAAAAAGALAGRAGVAVEAGGGPVAARADRRAWGGDPLAARVTLGGRGGAMVALGAASAALTGVLFLLVLLLVAGWSLEPLAAAAAVSVLPVAALAGARVRGNPAVRASAGCALIGAGVLALALLPDSAVAWIVAPQVLAGAGMGMALPALAVELVGERTPGEAAALLSVRHLGITLALVLIAPIAAAQLDSTVRDTREKGAALILDARLPPLDKLEMAGSLVADLDPDDARDALNAALDSQAPRFADDPEQRAEYAELTERADAMLLDEIGGAFRTALLIAGGLALIGAVAVLPRGATGATLAAAVASAALLLPAGYALARPHVGPEPVAIADPCEPRALPSTGGIAGFVQDRALEALDSAACRYHSSREELALALADPEEARVYERAHGVDPRSTSGLLDLIGISLGG